jgi:hypothetical protein
MLLGNALGKTTFPTLKVNTEGIVFKMEVAAIRIRMH